MDKPRVQPLDPPMVPFAVAGTAIWAVLGLVLLLGFRGWLSDHGHNDWLWTCVAGFLLGLLGLVLMIGHDRRAAARRAAAHPSTANPAGATVSFPDAG